MSCSTALPNWASKEQHVVKVCIELEVAALLNSTRGHLPKPGHWAAIAPMEWVFKPGGTDFLAEMQQGSIHLLIHDLHGSEYKGERWHFFFFLCPSY